MHEHEAFSPQQETAKRSRNSVQHLSSQFLSILGICPLSRLNLSLLPTSLKLLTTHYPRFLRSQPSSSQQVVEVGRDLPRGDLVVAAGQPAKVRPAAMTMRKRSESPRKKHGQNEARTQPQMRHRSCRSCQRKSVGDEKRPLPMASAQQVHLCTAIATRNTQIL